MRRLMSRYREVPPDPDCPQCKGDGLISQRTAAIWADELILCDCRFELIPDDSTANASRAKCDRCANAAVGGQVGESGDLLWCADHDPANARGTDG